MYAFTKCALLLCAITVAFGTELNSQNVVFHLFTINNPQISEPLLASMNSIITSTQFSLARKTVVTIHDFGESVSGNFNAFLVPSHLSVENVNLIAVDWSVGSSMYTIGLSNTEAGSLIIADFLNILIDTFGYNVDNIKIVGVGLGGHMAGIVARNVRGQVPHIVALDPSFVGWTYNPHILSPADAGLVEVLHTTSGIRGYDYPLGHLDFYPNGGTYQAGCATADCSHIYAYAFYAESLTVEVNGGNKFVGTECETYEDATIALCSGGQQVVFGGTEDKSGATGFVNDIIRHWSTGIYSFTTNAVPPFARG